MKRYLLFLLFFLNACGFAAIKTEIEPNVIHASEPFKLILSSDDGANVAAQPDLSPLQQAFDVIGTERSMSYSLINGQSQSIARWIIQLIPKKTGTIQIPSLSIGSQKSETITITVSDNTYAPSPNNSITQTKPSNKILLQSEVNQKKPYINQQVIYTVKLYNNKRLYNASYQPPHTDDALIVPFGDSQRKELIKDGEPYIVEEQHYAIFPQKSGIISIAPPVFEALVDDAWLQRVHLQADTVTLAVQPMPSNNSGKTWLPSQGVTIEEQNSPLSQQIVQGKPFERTIKLQAQAMPGELLPSITFQNTAEYSVYHDKPTIKNTVNNHSLLGEAVFHITYIANKEGQIIIPAIAVPWFNTETGKEEIATLRALTLKVHPKIATQPVQVQKVQSPTVHNAPPKKIAIAPQKHGLIWLTTILTIMGIIILAAIYWLNNRRVKKRSLYSLQKACMNNDAHALRAALLHWAKLKWPQKQILNIYDLLQVLDNPAICHELNKLSAAIYSQEKNIQWNGIKLWSLLKSYKKHKTTQHKHNVLPNF